MQEEGRRAVDGKWMAGWTPTVPLVALGGNIYYSYVISTKRGIQINMRTYVRYPPLTHNTIDIDSHTHIIIEKTKGAKH